MEVKVELLEHKPLDAKSVFDKIFKEVEEKEAIYKAFGINMEQKERPRELWIKRVVKFRRRNNKNTGYSAMNWNKINLIGRCKKKKVKKEVKKLSIIEQFFGR